jgi:hypothetical protein
MPISVSCPSCAAKLQAPDQAAGRKTKCPKCGGVIQIVAAAPAATAAASSIPAPAARPAPSLPAAPKSPLAQPAIAKPAVRLPMAQAAPESTFLGMPATTDVLPPLPRELPPPLPHALPPLPHALSPLPPLLSEVRAAVPTSYQGNVPVQLPQLAAPRRQWSIGWYVLGILAVSVFLSIVLEPYFRDEDRSARAKKVTPADDEEDLSTFNSIVEKVNAEYTIPNAEKKPPRPPAQLTPLESKMLFAINGDRLGMTTEEFRTKYRHSFKGDNRPSPMMSDNRNHDARRNNPLETLLEQPWHVDTNIVHARITWPFEDSANSPHTPSLGGSRAMDHMFMFVDEQLWRIQYVFPSEDFTKVKLAVIAQLGPPDTTPSPLGVGLRGARSGAVLSWTNELAQVDLIEHTLNGDRTNLVVRHLALEQVDTDRNSAKRIKTPATPPAMPPRSTTVVRVPPAPTPSPFVPRPATPIDRMSPPDVLNGDRLGMPLADFKTKYRRVSAANGFVYPLTTDTLTTQMRERSRNLGINEQPWYEPAGVVTGIIASPLELSEQYQPLPVLGSSLTVTHVYRFVDKKLYRIEMTFQRNQFDKLVKMLQEKNGPPGIAPDALQTTFTKQHGGQFLYWRIGNTETFLVERFGDSDHTLLYFSDLSLSSLASKRRTAIKGK